jgi:nucleoside-diphosphate-sugar epimerase
MIDNHLRGRTVLVTGAGGFIGSHLVEALVRSGARVRAMVRYRSDLDVGCLAALPDDVQQDVSVFRADLREPTSMREAVYDQELVFHLGALGSIPYSFANPLAFFETNVTGTGNLLDAAREAQVDRFVLMSTSEVYGTVDGVAITESRPTAPQSPYAASKVAAEQLVHTYVRAVELPATVVRAFNVYGPRQSTRNVIMAIISQALAGEVLHLGNLAPVRDYNYVTDTVSALLAVGGCDAAVGRTLNIGTGRGTSVGDVVLHVQDILGRPLEVVTDAERVRSGAIEVGRLVADASALEALTGWRPQVDVRSGLAAVVDWARGAGPRPTGYAV